MPPRSQKPEGRPTRGKTASNRLRRADNFLLQYDLSLLTRTDGLFAASLFVDLGYGADARTTLESSRRFHAVNPSLRILGVEIEPERVDAALPFADESTFFRLGGFNLPLLPGETVRLIRAFNVLRQYEEADVAPAYERLAEHVLPGGLMIEGTSTPFGQLWAANLVRKTEAGAWSREALVFSTNFRLGFEVAEFQTILPKNFIHRMTPGEPIHDFFEAWKRAAAETAAAKTYGLRQWFAAAAERLEAKGWNIHLQRKWLAKGYLILEGI
ncbi:MAG: methylase [Chloroflexota bacterium]